MISFIVYHYREWKRKGKREEARKKIDCASDLPVFASFRIMEWWNVFDLLIKGIFILVQGKNLNFLQYFISFHMKYVDNGS